MRLFGPNLRGTMTAAVVALAILTTFTAAALVALTTAVHSAGGRTAAALESVHQTEEIQRELLLHDRLRDPTARDQIRAGLRERMTDARHRVAGGSPEEQAAFAVADQKVESYLQADGAIEGDALSAVHAEAFATVDALLIQELGEARRARGTGYKVDDLADVIGAVVAAAVIVSAAVLVWWLRARALRPLLGLAQTMRRFGAGELDARAPSEGPAELSEMARQFNEMAGAISRQRRDRQAFIGGVVHDLRTPLSVLRMSMDLVTTGVQVPPERMTKVLGTVARQVTRLERMAGDLLESVTLEAGPVTLRSEDVDARELAVDVVQLYASSSSKHVIDVDLPEAAVRVSCDRMRLEQVLSNLLSNAIKYSPEGGTVSLSLVERGGEVVFTVRDEGIGMSETDAAVAFEPFRRSKELEDAVPGSGLGLFIVRRLVEAHGGRIDLETEAGKGSSFVVRIPTARAVTGPEALRGPLGGKPAVLRAWLVERHRPIRFANRSRTSRHTHPISARQSDQEFAQLHGRAEAVRACGGRAVPDAAVLGAARGLRVGKGDGDANVGAALAPSRRAGLGAAPAVAERIAGDGRPIIAPARGGEQRGGRE